MRLVIQEWVPVPLYSWVIRVPRLLQLCHLYPRRTPKDENVLRDLIQFEVPGRDHLTVAVHCEGGIEISERGGGRREAGRD